MEHRTYMQTISEINRFWDDEMAPVYQDDGFSQAVYSAMREVAHASQDKNKFYSAVYKIIKQNF